MNVLDTLVTFYNKSLEGDVYHEAVGQILQHLKELQGLTIYEMADLCFVSPTTLSRLSKKLGFLSFSDFKNHLTNAVHDYSGLNRCMPYTATDNCADTLRLYHKTIRECLQVCVEAIDPAYIEQIVTDMGRFKSIHFVSNVSINVSGFQQNLLMSGKNSVSVTTIPKGLQFAETLDADCLVISFITKLRESVVMLDVLKTVRKTGASTLVITPAVLSPYDKYANYLLSYEGTGTSLDQYTINFCMNLLSMSYRSRYVD